MNEEQCDKCHSMEEPILYRVSCEVSHYEWLCTECINEVLE